MSTLLTLLLLTLVLGLVATAGAAVLCVWGVRRLGRTALTRLAAARRQPVLALLPGRGLVEVWAWLPGPARQVTAIRRDLRRDVAAAVRAVQAGRAAGRPVQELVPLTGRLRRAAAELDLDLSVIAAEPDGAGRGDLLAAERERIAVLRRSCSQLRRAVLLAGSATSGAQLPRLVDEVDDELVRLCLWAQAHAELLGRHRR